MTTMMENFFGSDALKQHTQASSTPLYQLQHGSWVSPAHVVHISVMNGVPKSEGGEGVYRPGVAVRVLGGATSLTYCDTLEEATLLADKIALGLNELRKVLA